TLMLAGAITIVLQNINFPNGGHGFTGYDASTVHIPPIRRPSIATSDPAFFRYSMIVAVLMFLLVLVHLRGKPGRAWAAIRQSESAALAGGINTTLYKLWAFALASFGIGVLQVLTTAPRGIVEQMPKDLAKLGRLIRGLFARPAAEQETSS